MMIPAIDQGNAGSFLENIGSNVTDFVDGVKGFKDGTVEAIENIGDLCKIILNAVDWFLTVVKNPIIILTFADQMSIVVIITLLVLKFLGFEDLEKWMWVIIISQVVAMAFI